MLISMLKYIKICKDTPTCFYKWDKKHFLWGTNWIYD